MNVSKFITAPIDITKKVMKNKVGQIAMAAIFGWASVNLMHKNLNDPADQARMISIKNDIENNWKLISEAETIIKARLWDQETASILTAIDTVTWKQNIVVIPTKVAEKAFPTPHGPNGKDSGISNPLPFIWPAYSDAYIIDNNTNSLQIGSISVDFFDDLSDADDFKIMINSKNAKWGTEYIDSSFKIIAVTSPEFKNWSIHVFKYWAADKIAYNFKHKKEVSESVKNITETTTSAVSSLASNVSEVAVNTASNAKDAAVSTVFIEEPTPQVQLDAIPTDENQIPEYNPENPQ